MGFDIDSVERYGLDDDFVAKQMSIRNSYEKMGVTPSFSCIPYEIFDIPEEGTQVAFAESNAAIHANSYDNLRTNKESAFSALASALTGKSPYSLLRGEKQAGYRRQNEGEGSRRADVRDARVLCRQGR